MVDHKLWTYMAKTLWVGPTAPGVGGVADYQNVWSTETGIGPKFWVLRVDSGNVHCLSTQNLIGDQKLVSKTSSNYWSNIHNIFFIKYALHFFLIFGFSRTLFLLSNDHKSFFGNPKKQTPKNDFFLPFFWGLIWVFFLIFFFDFFLFFFDFFGVLFAPPKSICDHLKAKTAS